MRNRGYKKKATPTNQDASKKNANQDASKKQAANANRDEFTRILKQFKSSSDGKYEFKESLNKKERAVVHEISMKMGMRSKSHGQGKGRHVSVYKVNFVQTQEPQTSFKFCEGSKDVIQNLFSVYPPDEAEMNQNQIGESRGRTVGFRAGRDDMFAKPGFTKSEIVDKVKTLALRIKNSGDLKQIAEKRSKLPIASFKDKIISTMKSHQVVLIRGETGCGKTTQVPQFLLDHAWSEGKTCKVVCSQPRRISAISVAERVASERGEGVGDSVGYKIRLESKGGRHSSVVFCTNGLLLNVLASKDSQPMGKNKKEASTNLANSLSNITHIIVDEIHERDRFSDIMLAVLRKVLPLYPQLRVVLMSATIDAERFSEYFSGCPIIEVPGFTYPVKSFYLEDVIPLVRSNVSDHHLLASHKSEENGYVLTEEWKVALDEAIDLAFSDDDFESLLELISSEGDSKIYNYQHSVTGLTPLMVLAGKGRVGDICMLLSLNAESDLRSIDGKTAFDYATQSNHEEAAKIIKKHMEKMSIDSEHENELFNKYLSKANPEIIDYVLIEQLLRKICIDSKDGAILVFLPGWDDINKTRDKLCASPYFKDGSKFMILSLHSMVPSADQKTVFKQPPRGCRKIILSTNIAETSVTIDDVVYVIDSGRMKEKNYDPFNNVSTLHSDWISKASAKQRAGRAGRCQPGICYRLYSKSKADSLADFQIPELKRMPIDEICLQVKLMDPSAKIEEFLQQTLDPPIKQTICNAVASLQDIGALSSDEKLTDLGEKLGSLPVHPRTSKMLLLAILLNCLDPALTLACAFDYKDPFLSPMLPDQKAKATSAKLELSSFYGGNGDQFAVIAAFACWRMAKKKGLASMFCSKYFLSENTMKMISRMRERLESQLVDLGFVPRDTLVCNMNSRDPGIIQAVIVAGLYPKVGKLVRQGPRFLVKTVKGDRVALKPFSAIGKLSIGKNNTSLPLVIFDEITRGDWGLSIRSSSVVGSLPLLLLANEITVRASSNDDGKVDAGKDDKETGAVMSSAENSIIAVADAWLPFKSMALDVAQIYCLRERISAAILFKITYPRQPLPLHLEASFHALSRILSYDGMSGISFPPKGSPPKTSSADADPVNNVNEEVDETSTQYLKVLMNEEERRNVMSYNEAAHQVSSPPHIPAPQGRSNFLRKKRPSNHTKGSAVNDSKNGSAVNDSKNGSAVSDSKNGSAVSDSKNGSAVNDSKNGSAVNDSKNGSAVNRKRKRRRMRVLPLNL